MTFSAATFIIIFLWMACGGLILRNLQLKRRLRRAEARAAAQPVAQVEAPVPTRPRPPPARTELLEKLSMTPGMLPAGGDWRAGDDLLTLVVDEIFERRPEVVVELGSGLSTAVIARALQLNGRGRLVSLEHDPTFAEETEEMIESLSLTEQVDLVDAPLDDYGPSGQWYASPALARVPERIDLLFIDGPPHFAGKAPRYPAGPELFSRIAPSGLVVLDDGRRNKEQKVLRMWAKEFPEFQQEISGTAKQAALLRSPAAAQ